MKRKALVAAICEILFVVWQDEYIAKLTRQALEPKVLTVEWEAPNE